VKTPEFGVRFAGFGGQGILTAGYLLGLAATIYAGKNALQTQSYGPESRGGASLCDVSISDEPIRRLKIKTLDTLVVMSQEAYDKYRKLIKTDGRIIYDKSLVRIEEEDRPKAVGVPATKIAIELGSRMMANVVMLGALFGATKLIDAEALKTAIKNQFPRHAEANLKAFEEGMKQVERH